MLCRAIAEKAITSGDLDTTNAFADSFPALNDAVQRLWSAENRRMTGLDLTTTWRVAALKPAALNALQDYEIEQAAAGNLNGAWSAS